MKVSDLMSRHVLSVSPDTRLRTVQLLMLRYHLNDLLVTEDKKTLVGIVTYKDLFRKFLPSYEEVMEDSTYWTNPDALEERMIGFLNRPVSEVMTTKVYTVSPDLQPVKAAALMNAHRVKQLPVVENDRLLGIISYSDISWGVMLRFLRDISEEH